jgi:hypothetical protein
MAYTDYTTAVADSYDELTDVISLNMVSGWQPYGFPIMISRNNSRSFQLMQAMVKGGPVEATITADDITDAGIMGKTLIQSNVASDVQSALHYAASGANSDITSLSAITTPFTVAQGGTGSNIAATSRTNLGAAASGINSDITALNGLTTALPITEGGTGNALGKAAALTTPSIVSLTGGATAVGVSFDGSANLSLATVLATPTTVLRGGALQMTFTTALSIAPTAIDFNALLTKLIGAGLMAAS